MLALNFQACVFNWVTHRHQEISKGHSGVGWGFHGKEYRRQLCKRENIGTEKVKRRWKIGEQNWGDMEGKTNIKNLSKYSYAKL